ncbi:hypothetical protein CHS0354_041818 [Potamilus streckersoni]|nr:hypothetical protein CHS0354_041818 [Potamilus streckersoni]
MTCNVSNYYGLTRVEIYQESQRIVNITSSNRMVNTSRITLKEGNITTSSAIVRIGFSNQVDCSDKGLYYCIVTGYQVSNLTLKLDLLRTPSKPVLTLSREIVEGKATRTDLPFICEGDIGFPAGNLVLGSNFTSSFIPTITNINTTISENTCRAYQKIAFSYTFSLNWHGKEILCSSVNNRSLGQNGTPPFDKQLVEVVPATYCHNLPGRQYYHPYKCNNFVDCVNGIVNVGMCPATLCFGVNETDSCNFCTSTLCVSNVANRICPGSNAEAMPYPGLRCSMYVNCTDWIVHECPRNECFNVNNKTCPSWTQPMTSSPPPVSNANTTQTTSIQVPGTSTTPIPSTTVVTFESSKREVYIGDSDLSMTCNVSKHQHLTRVEISSRLGNIANITQQLPYKYKTGVVVSDGSFVKENNASVKITFAYNLTCNDDGKYDCKAIGNTTVSSSINLTILSKPNIPTLTLSPWIVENQTTLSDRMFRCEGMVGKPVSQMFVEANISGSFEQYNFPSVINNTEFNCSTKQNYQFSYAFDMSWHGRSIRCTTSLNISSDPKTIEVVPANYCVNMGTGDDKFYPHPYECGKYIRCYQYKIIGIAECGSDLCFGVNQTLTGQCTYCTDKYLMCLKGSRKPT